MLKSPVQPGSVPATEASNARSAILDAAEAVFSQSGYDGASMRMIASEAGVAQALLHYHFHNKDRLFEAVFERRSTAASGHRGQQLSELMEREPNPSLESVLRVLFIPHQESAEPGSILGGYFQLVAAIGVGSDARSKDLIARYFDPIAHRFIQAFLQAVPGLTPENAVWSYLFAIGSRMQAQATNDRADRLCHALGIQKPEPFELLVPFVASGIRSMVKPKAGTAGQT